jgi:hypothetical protein
MARAQSSLTATTDSAFATSLVVQLTAGVLSEKSRQCCRFVGISYSRMSIWPMMAAIPRSLLVIMPCRYRCTASLGHLIRHTVGGKAVPNHTPPAPLADALQVPAALGVSWTRSLTWVSRMPREAILCRRSASAIRSSLCLPTPIFFGPPHRALYRGVVRPFAAGTRFLSVLMETLVFRVFSHTLPRESTVDSYPIFKLAGMTTVFSI